METGSRGAGVLWKWRSGLEKTIRRGRFGNCYVCPEGKRLRPPEKYHGKKKAGLVAYFTRRKSATVSLASANQNAVRKIGATGAGW